MNSFKTRSKDQHMYPAGAATLLENAANLGSQDKLHAAKLKIAVLMRGQVFFQFCQPSGVGEICAG